ncbi:MAG: Amuc_1100 family pilus-like protein [Chthoniobacterales bacterium]
MNWIKSNTFLSAYLAITVVAIAAAAYFAWTSYSKYNEQASAYESSIQKLHGLQEQSPLPSEENLKATEATVTAYQERLAAFKKELSGLQPPIPEGVTPESFQDDLRKRVTKVIEAAAAANVTLPENFYLGFDSYERSLPAQEAAPELSRQLSDIEQIVNILVENQVNITSLVRAPLPIESNKQIDPKVLFSKNILDLVVSGEQARIRPAFNNILVLPRFIIMRAIDFENSQQNGPPKIQVQAPNTPTVPTGENADNTAQQETSKSQLNVILGRETVQASLRLEILDLLFAQNSPATN